MAAGGISGRIDKLLEVLEGQQQLVEGTSNRDIARAILMAIHEQPKCAPAIEKALGVKKGYFKAMAERAEAERETS